MITVLNVLSTVYSILKLTSSYHFIVKIAVTINSRILNAAVESWTMSWVKHGLVCLTKRKSPTMSEQRTPCKIATNMPTATVGQKVIPQHCLFAGD